MLSELGKVQKQLLRFIRNWSNLKRVIESSPKIPMSKQVHSQQSYQVRKGLIKLRSELKEAQDQHCDQCCPNLNPDGIGAFTVSIPVRLYYKTFNSSSSQVLIINALSTLHAPDLNCLFAYVNISDMNLLPQQQAIHQVNIFLLSLQNNVCCFL